MATGDIMAFYNHLVKDEMDENTSQRMEAPSPQNSLQIPMGGSISHSSQGVGGAGGQHPIMPLAPLTSNNNSLMQSLHHRRLESESSTLEPLARGRSNTWPVTCPEYAETEEAADPAAAQDPTNLANPGSGEAAGPPKKNTSRRNPWGNLSYADLIAKAITSSPDNRATLSQVYDWMVNNIPYFKDKGDSNSSAGWKVTIRAFLIREISSGFGRENIDEGERIRLREREYGYVW